MFHAAKHKDRRKDLNFHKAKIKNPCEAASRGEFDIRRFPFLLSVLGNSHFNMLIGENKFGIGILRGMKHKLNFVRERGENLGVVYNKPVAFVT